MAYKFAYVIFLLYLCSVKTRKEAYMQAAVVPNYDIVQVRVPHIELRRFKTIVKALGCMVETLSPIERSLREAESGEILHYESLDDLIKEIG